jgi:hypothetical protein
VNIGSSPSAFLGATRPLPGRVSDYNAIGTITILPLGYPLTQPRKTLEGRIYQFNRGLANVAGLGA